MTVLHACASSKKPRDTYSPDVNSKLNRESPKRGESSETTSKYRYPTVPPIVLHRPVAVGELIPLLRVA